MAPTITLHFLALPGTRADRLFWVLEELGLQYNVVCHVPGKGGIPQSLKDVSKLGKSPVIEIDGRIATETGSIIHNLVGAHSTPEIERSPSNDSYFWSLFSEGTMMLHLQPARVLGMMDGAMGKRLSKEGAEGAHALYKLFNDNWVSKNVQSQLDVVEDFLSKNKYFSGNDKIGEGDFMMAYPLNVLAYGMRTGEFKIGAATQKWLDGMRARPAWKRALERIEAARKAQAKL
ncbi:hypothetical protein CcaverHIS002_0108580 [Cutaneotrichosporon cavernicola]|uniref:GST N-terminal domain-containing protein n=1 Tax=Cutaneotrichosporon cavernicola TaxID=279322 RepID=A0AA48HZ01_9TREE|nr:uncharacterized protein CcaverHIS019_0108520 [Cutaneotrichosporon cavernicola]BEI80329.1 hypothetical protein CcaverHIS002_0108580 [Cutaneotrichosporon cavernicola]BEI88134.1 hypothetical protein CcaverHIS019_0108520 [Cutaneotrichosporon cavernicola]BEI95904.1 hypothetical protein CcaverHIS631_0108530 [Cutaneotrichosporon cavernicola]